MMLSAISKFIKTRKRCRDKVERPLKLFGHRLRAGNAGFTLIEVLIAMGISGVVLAGIYGAYQGQLKTFNTQEQIVDMQQNIRVGLYFIEKELRMAGLDPTGNAGAGITVANADTITFSMDFTGGAGDGIDNDGDTLVDEGSDGSDSDGDTLIDEPDEAEWYNGTTADANEQVTYALSNDADGDGINDGLPTQNADDSTCDLLRNGQVLASNIDALNFVYLGVDPAQTGCNEDCQLALPIANPDDIRSVQVTLVARAGAVIPGMSFRHTDQTAYYNLHPADQIILPAQNDGFRRIRLTSVVRCRNLGL
jgi:type IV pilus assembly protein PilW